MADTDKVEKTGADSLEDLLGALFDLSSVLEPKEYVVKVNVTALEWNYKYPWKAPSTAKWHGSGFVVEGNKIITNAHVASGAAYIEVKLADDTEPFVARVRAISNDTDLAMLEVDDPDFANKVTPVAVSEDTDRATDVEVQGFPMGGDALSVTRGVLSRTERTYYAQSGKKYLTQQTDAAINPGNSGGPVVNDNGEVVGVAFQGLTRGQNIGYMIPGKLVNHFIKQVEENNIGFPGLALDTQTMMNAGLREHYRMSKEQSGILITKIPPTSAALGILEPGDVIMEVNGMKIENDGTVKLPVGVSDHRVLINEKAMGDKLSIQFLRHGDVMTKNIELTNTQDSTKVIMPEEYGKPPTYFFVSGAMAVQPLTENFIYDTRRRGYKNKEKKFPSQQAVVISNFLTDRITRGYEQFEGELIVKANGKDIGNFDDFMKAIEGNCEADHFIETKNGHKIVLPNNSVDEQKCILRRYQITNDRSPDLRFGVPEETCDADAKAILDHYKGRKVAAPKPEMDDLLGGLLGGLFGGLTLDPKEKDKEEAAERDAIIDGAQAGNVLSFSKGHEVAKEEAAEVDAAATAVLEEQKRAGASIH